MPPDPADVTVIDRFLYRGSTDGEEHVIHITLYNSPDSVGTVHLQNGLILQDGWHWETVFIWQPESFQGTPIFIQPGSILTVERVSSSLYITWIQELDYVEGLASLYLDYNLASRDAITFFVD